MNLLLDKLKKKTKHGGVINGFGLYDKPILVTYSRSGTNWVRYFIEEVSGKPTPGEKRLLEGSDYIVDRAHAGYKVVSKYSQLIVIVRNYRECIVRHHGINRLTDYETISEFLSDQNLNQPPAWYIKNISAFDEFKGNKILLYYEDLIENPKISFLDIGRVLNLDLSKINQFLASLDQHKSSSIKAYTRFTHKSITNGERSKQTHFTDQITSTQAEEFDSFYKSNYPKLFDKYLKRYELTPSRL